MYRYVQDYCAAYPLETAGTMKAAIDRMASFLSSGRVLFDPARVRFEPVAGGRLVDCTSPEGAAVRVALPDGAVYDMWTVFGVQGGHPTLVR